MSTPFITLEPDADARTVQARLTALGLWTRRLETGTRAGLQVTGPSPRVPTAELLAIDGVAEVFIAGTPHPLVDAQARRTIDLGRGVQLGHGVAPVLFAGPCSAEGPDSLNAIAAAASAAGARVLRGGAFKPRTSPYSFSGHGLEALRWLREAADAHSLLVCTEVMAPEDTDAVATHADILQIGSRNMQNFALLKAVGPAHLPVLLKRAMSSSIDEWLLAGEHLLAAGAAAVVFCERGITGFDRHTRNLLDLAAVAVLDRVYGQPVIVDPSHAVGRRDLIPPLAHAALAVGAQGLMIEAHPNAGAALSDGPQALTLEELTALGRQLGIPMNRRNAA